MPDKMPQEARKAYRIAFDFHERNVGRDLYEEAIPDMKETARGKSQFCWSLLIAVYEELTRDYKSK